MLPLGYCSELFHCTLISLILSEQQILAGKKSIENTQIAHVLKSIRLRSILTETNKQFQKQVLLLCCSTTLRCHRTFELLLYHLESLFYCQLKTNLFTAVLFQTFLLNRAITLERILDFKFICGKIDLCMNTFIYDFNWRNFLILSDMFLGSKQSYHFLQYIPMCRHIHALKN